MFIHRHLENVDSTQALARSKYQELRPNQLVLYSASWQNAGFGQFGRKWISPKNNIYTTYCFLLDAKYTDRIDSITQLVSAQVLHLLAFYHLQGAIKFPNDVLINGKKICGILCQSLHNSFTDKVGAKYHAVLIGIGINVNASADQLQQVDQACTSMQLETGLNYDIQEVTNRLSKFIMHIMQDLQKA